MWNIKNKNSGKLLGPLNEDGTFNEASEDLPALKLTARDAENFILRHGSVNFECVPVKEPKAKK
jgi:hypothetical protein